MRIKTKYRCPLCKGPAHWRTGVGFEHQKRCPKCNFSWEPGEEIEVREEVEIRVEEIWDDSVQDYCI